MNVLTDEIGSVTKFLAGSTSKRIPYEIVYSLRIALSSWITKNALITTAISPDFRSGFYFQGVSPKFNSLTKAYLNIEFDQQLVQISLPQLYRHRPIYNIPLFHELGHFLDTHHQVTVVSLILYDLSTPLPNVDHNSLSPDQLNFVQHRHRMEYFADLFATSYMGMAYHDFLESFAYENTFTLTHPITQDRLNLIRKFLDGQQDPLINMFNQALKALNLPQLKLNHAKLDISQSFDNFRPYPLKSDEEVHGLFASAWGYLQGALNKPQGAWLNLQDAQIERIINNLVEKSIRNRMVQERWGDGITNP